MKGVHVEFPEFPRDAFPALPEGFEDTSWHNDAMPCMSNEALRLHVWVDDPRSPYRDFPFRKCFAVVRLTDDGSLSEEPPILETDGWTTVLALIRSVREAHA
jgi:hypothetical protein